MMKQVAVVIYQKLKFDNAKNEYLNEFGSEMFARVFTDEQFIKGEHVPEWNERIVGFAAAVVKDEK